MMYHGECPSDWATSTTVYPVRGKFRKQGARVLLEGSARSVSKATWSQTSGRIGLFVSWSVLREMCKPGGTDLALTATKVQLRKALPEQQCTGRLQCRRHKARSMARKRRESLKASVTLAAAGAWGQETPHAAWITASDAKVEKHQSRRSLNTPPLLGAVR